MTITPNVMDIDEDHKPRYMVFSKMEKIIRDMQHADTGVPVRCQKIFLTTIPCAFTGYDLIEWLMERLHIEDSTEALHLSGLLCQYGYFFPVADTKSLLVKDDGTLYRFQSPYFWPSQNWEPDNVDYAIYLAKRSMRNKQRHGLDDHEQASFNKLQKMLCDKWDFILMQAEEQVRLAKERKKADKVVLDSQERAFWRVHRPGPLQVKCLEEGVRRNYQPSQMARRKKKNIEGIKKEIDFLQHCLKQARMKTSKAAESLQQRIEQFYEHDPFLSQPQPSNPWITEDITHWQLLSEGATPTERQVRRWAYNIQEVLTDPKGCQEFELFLTKEYSSENLHFWQACEELRASSLSKVGEVAHKIYREFLALGAPHEINIDAKTMDYTVQRLKNPDRFTMDRAQDHIYTLMKKDSYNRFIRSDHFKYLLANAVNPCPKKKFFNFGGAKKKSPNPSPKPKRRGSASDDIHVNNKMTTEAGLSQHSFSTGNLHELDINDKSGKSSPFGSTGDVKGESKKGLSVKTLHNKLEDLMRHGSPGRKSLEVPAHQHRALIQRVTKGDVNMSVNIAVPNTKVSNVVTPWEDEEEEENGSNHKVSNVVAPWEDEDSGGKPSNPVAPWEDEDSRGKPSNPVAPWEDEDSGGKPSNPVAPWEDEDSGGKPSNPVAPWEDEDSGGKPSNPVAPWEDEDSGGKPSNPVAPWEDEDYGGKPSNPVAPWEDEDSGGKPSNPVAPWEDED